LPANRQFFSFEENVKLDVFTLALVFPRISAPFQLLDTPALITQRKLLLRNMEKLVSDSLER
jgi:hypothetical protein